MLTSKISGPSHSRYLPPVSRAPASELVLQRGGLVSEIAFQGGNLESKIVYCCITSRSPLGGGGGGGGGGGNGTNTGFLLDFK